MIGRLAMAGFLTALALGCRSAAEPRPGDLGPGDPGQIRTIPLGAYVFAAQNLASDVATGCGGNTSYIGVAVRSPVILTREGDTAVVRSATPQDGTLEVRFWISGEFLGLPTLAGTATGSAIDRRAGVATIAFAGTTGPRATLRGGYSPRVAWSISGDLFGTFAASNAFGSETCAHAGWELLTGAP